MLPSESRAPSTSGPREDEPLSIAYLTYRGKPHVGGQGVYTRHLTKALVDLGHHVEVLGGQPYPIARPSGRRCIELPSLDIYNDYFPMRMPGLWELKSLGDWVEVTAFSTGTFPEPLAFSVRAAPVPAQPGQRVRPGAGQPVPRLRPARPCERMGLPVLATIHHPITVDRRLEMEHAETVLAAATRKARWYAFTKMQTRVAAAHAPGHHGVAELPRRHLRRSPGRPRPAARRARRRRPGPLPAAARRRARSRAGSSPRPAPTSP